MSALSGPLLAVRDRAAGSRRIGDSKGRPLAVAVSGLLDEFERREAEIAATIHDAVARFLPEDPSRP